MKEFILIAWALSGPQIIQEEMSLAECKAAQHAAAIEYHEHVDISGQTYTVTPEIECVAYDDIATASIY